eukprot:SAG11_NODE_2374_length_3444_cov_2.210762_1_plen_255_part_10
MFVLSAATAELTFSAHRFSKKIENGIRYAATLSLNCRSRRTFCTLRFTFRTISTFGDGHTRYHRIYIILATTCVAGRCSLPRIQPTDRLLTVWLAARSLLMFDEGKPLGADGMYWLKLQTANLWGQDKLSNDDRCVRQLKSRCSPLLLVVSASAFRFPPSPFAVRRLPSPFDVRRSSSASPSALPSPSPFAVSVRRLRSPFPSPSPFCSYSVCLRCHRRINRRIFSMYAVLPKNNTNAKWQASQISIKEIQNLQN